MKRLVIILWCLVQAIVLMAGELHLKITGQNGTERFVSVTDGLEISFSENDLTIRDDAHSISYSLSDVKRLEYVLTDQIDSIDRIEVTPRINITPAGVELSMGGDHRLRVVTLGGNSLLTEDFTDRIVIGRDKLPAGVLILSVDDAFSLKISSK
ncbi:MAG: hypothetical protein K2K82_10275 [Muribaculaceae bacterium]|nr:hypothetical protein [Muribaculaceae bacterium]